MTASPLPTAPGTLRVDIWSDIACPWCYIGKRRFETALRDFPHREDVELVWHSFELDPGAPERSPLSSAQMLAQKYGRTAEQAQQMLDSVTRTAAAEGLHYDFSTLQLGNTFLAHQLLHLAGTQGRADQMKERLLRAHFTEGEAVSDLDTLVRLAGETGLNPDEVRAALHSGQYTQAVRQDEAQARTLGIDGVPFFVLGGKYGISGAQAPELFTQALRQVWDETHPAPLTRLNAPNLDGCEDGQCAVPTATSP